MRDNGTLAFFPDPCQVIRIMYDTEIGYEMSRQSFLPYSTRRFRIKAMRQFIRRA